MHQALIDRAITKEGNRHPIFTADFTGQRHAGRVGHLRAHNAIRAHQPQRRIDKVHGATFALGKTGCLAQHFGNRAAGIHPTGQ